MCGQVTSGRSGAQRAKRRSMAMGAPGAPITDRTLKGSPGGEFLPQEGMGVERVWKDLEPPGKERAEHHSRMF